MDVEYSKMTICILPVSQSKFKVIFSPLFFFKPAIQIISKSHQLRQHRTHTGPDHFLAIPLIWIITTASTPFLFPPLPSWSCSLPQQLESSLRCQVMHFLFTMTSWISILPSLTGLGFWPPVLGLNLLPCPLAHPLKPWLPALLSTPGWVLPQGLHYKFWPELFSPSGPRTLTFFRTLPKCYFHSPFSDHPI